MERKVLSLEDSSLFILSRPLGPREGDSAPTSVMVDVEGRREGRQQAGSGPKRKLIIREERKKRKERKRTKGKEDEEAGEAGRCDGLIDKSSGSLSRRSGKERAVSGESG